MPPHEDIRELDVMELLVDIEGEDPDGAARTFSAGSSGAIVLLPEGADLFWVEVVRADGPDWPAPDFRGQTIGFFWAHASQCTVIWRLPR